MGLAGPLVGRGCHPRPPPLDVPEELLRAAARFPAARPDLRPAAPLEPLLAADAPEGLAMTEPSATALNVRPGEPILIRFNRPMVEGARVGKPAAGVVDFTPPVRGRVRWTSRSAASFEADAETWTATRTSSMSLSPDLRSLAGETVVETPPRTVVFDAGPRFTRARHASRLLPGEPLELLFSGKVDARALASQLLVYEVNGGRRMLPYSIAERRRDGAGLVPIELSLRQALEPGARFAVAMAPPIAWGGSSPRVVHVEIAPRPKIEGIDCPETATEVSACTFDGPPGRIVDIGEALRLLASESVRELPKDAIEVKPALEALSAKLEDSKRIVIRGDWDPGQVYEVRVSGLRDAEGRLLQRMPPLAVRSAGRAPEVRAKAGRLVFERDARASIALSAIHVEQGEARIGAVPPGHEIEAALAPSSWTSPLRVGQYASVPLAELVPSARANRWGRGSLAWMDRGGKDASIAVLSLLPSEASRTAAAPPATFVQRTDLGLDVKLLARGALVWLTSISTARPVAGARITVADAKGEALAAATTDANGLAWAPLDARLLEAGGAVLAALGDDRAVMVVDPRTAIGPRHLGLTPGEAPPAAGAWVATVLTDRGICRPGETIHAKAVVREGGADGEALIAPLAGAVTMRLFGPTGEAPIEERVVALSAFGTADASYDVSAGAAPGAYRIEVRRDGHDKPAGAVSFTVGDYRPPTFRVDLSAAAEDLLDKDALRVSATATYMFGPPAAGAPARWTLVRDGAASFPSRWAAYAFGPVDASSRGGTVAAGAVKLDADGRVSVETPVTLGGPTREHALFEITVSDVSGLTTTARKRVRVRPASFEVGLRRVAPWMDYGATIGVDAIVLGGDGELAKGRTIEARIVREGWHRYWEWAGAGRHDDEGEDAGDERGRYEARRAHKREVMHRCALSSSDEPARCGWKAERAGTYVIEVVTEDDRGRRSIASQRVYVAGPDEHPDRDPPGTAIALTPAKRTYEVGETAEIAFESPFPDADALFTVEREGIVAMEERRVHPGGNVIRFPVTKAMVPNAFVSLSLVRPRTGPPGKRLDLDAPDLRVGLAEIGVRPAASPLVVRVEASERALAGSDVEIAIDVRDAAGDGVAAEVALVAVDEATLRVTGYTLPDPLSGLLRRMPPAFAWEDLRRALLKRTDEGLASSAGGDGGPSAAGRKAIEEERFDPTPLWLPRLTTDESGHAAAKLRLPARPTQYRIMAVAVDDGTRAGRAERTIVATMPLVVRPVLPAAATAGDRFQAVAFVHNTEDAPAEVTVTPVVDGLPRDAQTIVVPARSEARVAEWVDVPRAEDLVVRFEASAEGGSALAEGRVRVSQRGRTARSEAVGAVLGRREIQLDLPASAAEGKGTFTLAIAAHPFVGFDASLDALSASPDAAAEASASGLLGLAAHASLDTVQRPGGIGEAELRARAASAIARLLSLQTTSGGFGDFAASSPPDTYISTYVLHALAAAKRAGFTVPEAAIDRARRYLRGEVRDTSILDRGDGAHDQLAFALRVLTEVGEPDADRIQALYGQRERLTPYGLAELAIDPSDRRRDTLVLDASRRVLATREDEKKNARVLRWYDSSARTLGAVLEAALAVPVGTPDAGRLASRILAARSEHEAAWWPSHESSPALTALAAYAASVRAEAPIAPRVLVDGAPIEAARKSDAVAWYALPAARVAGGPHALTIEVRGQAWFSVAARWSEPLGPSDEVARGELAALHRVLEDATGKRLAPGAHVKLGELVRVRLFLYSEGETPPYLAVRDRLAGGLDPVDAAHETTARASLWALLGMGPDDDVVDARGHWAARSLDAITHRAFSPSKATFYLARGARGLRELTYGARATAVGTFALPPAEVEALYDASFVARSAVSSITVDP